MSSSVGKVFQVDYNYVQVEIDKNISNMNLLHNGIVHKIGHVGNFLQIIVGLYKVIGIVENTKVLKMQSDEGSIEEKKVISLNIIGCIDENGVFKNGLAILPNINDSVELMNLKYYDSIYSTVTKYPLFLGKSYYRNELEVGVDLNSFVLNHSGVFGSTGTGKSNMVASTLLNLSEKYHSSRAVIIDVHGEYKRYLGNSAKEFTASSTGTNQLVVPYWLLKFNDFAKLLGIQESNAFGPTKVYEEVSRLITNEKKLIAPSYGMNVRDVNRDTPLPFNVREIWYTLHKYGYATFNVHVMQRDSFLEDGIQYVLDENENPIIGDANALLKPRFKSIESARIFTSNKSEYQSVADNLYRILKDDRMDFMFGNNDYTVGTKGLEELIKTWIDHDKNISIINLEGAPLSILDLTISSLTNIIFDVVIFANKLRNKNNQNVYESRPLLFCFEEAHVYLLKDKKNKSTLSCERIMKEGRKYGIGAMIISQRPSEISSTILSQLGTLISFNLANSEDISIVNTYATNNSKYIINSISSLDIGESIIIGKSIKVPARIYTMELESVRKVNFTEKVSEWTKEKRESIDYKNIVDEWRKGY